jgi:MarR family transcriptional regulator for hemolysin
VTAPELHELDAPPWQRVESTLMATARIIRRAYEIRLAPLDLNLTQASLLAFLYEAGPITQSRLASRLEVGRAAAGLVIDTLEERKLVERRANPGDRRAWLIALRPEGVLMTKPIFEIDVVLRGELRVGISGPERQQLAGLLVRLQSNLASVLAVKDR